MTHIDWEILALYLAGEASPEQWQQLQDAAAQDSDFAKALVDFTRIWEQSQLLGRKDAVALDATALDGCIARLKDRITVLIEDEHLISLFEYTPVQQPDVTGIDDATEDERQVRLICQLAGGLKEKLCQKVDEHVMDAAMSRMKSRCLLQKAIQQDQVAVPATRPAGLRVWRYAPMAAASVVLVLAAIGIWKWFYTPDAYTVIAQERMHVYLPDSSEVWLDKGAVLTYDDTQYGLDDRTVTLEGEAFFDVVRRPDKPFIVQTGNALTKVLGTSFRLVARGEETDLAVVTGKVWFANAEDTLQSMVLTANQAAVLQQNALTSVSFPDEAALLMATELVFKATPLKTVVSQLSKAYGVKIILASESMGSRRFTGTLKDKPIEVLLEQVAIVVDLKLDKVGDTYVFSDR